MKPSIAILAALLLAPCACTRHQQAAPAAPAVAAAFDPGPAVQPAQPPPPPAAEPDPQPTAEEIAAFHAKVPK